MINKPILENLFDHAFPLADELSVMINDSIKKMVTNEKINASISDAIILHSVAMMLMICTMNREVLETGELESTFAKVKKITSDYMVHVLNLPRERKGEEDDNAPVKSTPTILNS